MRVQALCCGRRRVPSQRRGRLGPFLQVPSRDGMFGRQPLHLGKHALQVGLAPGRLDVLVEENNRGRWLRRGRRRRRRQRAEGHRLRVSLRGRRRHHLPPPLPRYPRRARARVAPRGVRGRRWEHTAPRAVLWRVLVRCAACLSACISSSFYGVRALSLGRLLTPLARTLAPLCAPCRPPGGLCGVDCVLRQAGGVRASGQAPAEGRAGRLA